MTLVGGMGTIFGPVVGATAMVAIESYLAELGSWVVVTQGAIFAACVLVLRQGIYGQLLWWVRSITRGRRSTGANHSSHIAPLEIEVKS